MHVSNKSPYTALEDQSDFMKLMSKFGNNSEISSTIIKSPTKHSRYLGEIKGMILCMEFEGLSSYLDQL